MNQVLKTASVAALLWCVGCAPGLLRDLPDPVFATPAQPKATPAPSVKAPPPAPAPSRKPARRSIDGATVVVDAGHGGKDPGAQGVSVMPEKAVNLAVALILAQELSDRGAKVVTTRDTDRFITLDGRAAMAERNRADLFVSIHSDAAQRAAASGSTLYIARNASDRSRRAARSIEAAFKRARIECRGINGAGFRVLVGHSRPAVLVECGFLTNRNEARKLNTSSYQAKLALAIADGITDYFSK